MLSGESEMQDPSGAAPVRPMSPGCSRILGNRRLRPHRPNQPLKCPRCESVNTKFCYYNNYNLSQPRHFCKSCRRYWTEGGVLRNVPVGGGCRKAKRAKSRSSHNKREKRDSGRASPRSSSESSSLTATDPFSASDDVHTIPANPPLAVSSLPAVAVMDQITFPPESRLFSNPYPSPSVLEPSVLSAGLSSDAIFSDSDTFTSLLTGKIASSLHGSGLGYTASEFPFKFHHQKTDEMAQDANEMTVGFTDKLPSVNDMASLYESADNPGLTQFDWQTHTDPPPALFDLPNAVDSDYWGQNQWEDHDHHPLYLP